MWPPDARPALGRLQLTDMLSRVGGLRLASMAVLGLWCVGVDVLRALTEVLNTNQPDLGPEFRRKALEETQFEA
jgi:hypothetical protein